MQHFVTKRIRKFIMEQFPPARNCGDHDRLLGAGIVDSLGMLEVVSFLEIEFKIAVYDEELLPENFASIASLATFVERKLGSTVSSEPK